MVEGQGTAQGRDEVWKHGHSQETAVALAVADGLRAAWPMAQDGEHPVIVRWLRGVRLDPQTAQWCERVGVEFVSGDDPVVEGVERWAAITRDRRLRKLTHGTSSKRIRAAAKRAKRRERARQHRAATNPRPPTEPGAMGDISKRLLYEEAYGMSDVTRKERRAMDAEVMARARGQAARARGDVDDRDVRKKRIAGEMIR